MACGNDYEENVDNLLKLVYLHNIVSFRVREVRCTAGSSSGDNYMSVVKRVQIIENNEAAAAEQNDTNVISLIIKRQIPSLSRRQLYRCDEAFCNEIYAYTNVVPLLEQYISEPLFPKCFFAGKDEMGEIIMLEDLKSLGYHMQNRLTGLNVTYCELVMKELAKLHAASIAAKQLNTELFRKKCKHIRDIVYCKEAAEFYRNILETSIQESLGSLRISNIDGCLSEPIRLIEKLQSKLFSKIQNFVINSKESLNVMCHGDLWVNNIMFKNVAVTTSDVNTPSTQVNCTTPSAVKFIDLQAMRYTSPVIDILHFIYTSTKRELRETYLKPLLQTYCVTLLANLEIQFNKARETENFKQLERVKDTFSLHNITQEYFEHVLYGLAISMWILPAVTFDPNNIPNLDQISETTPNAKEIKCTQKLTQEYHSRVKELALEFYQNGYLNSYLDDE